MDARQAWASSQKKDQEYFGTSIKTDKQNYKEYMSTLKSDRITSHNSQPWFFLENLAKSGTLHIDVIEWEIEWDSDCSE
jgi:hypothetical protein